MVTNNVKIGSSDNLLIYLTLFITYCLKLVEKEVKDTDARKKLLDISREPVVKPSGTIDNKKKRIL